MLSRVMLILGTFGLWASIIATVKLLLKKTNWLVIHKDSLMGLFLTATLWQVLWGKRTFLNADCHECNLHCTCVYLWSRTYEMGLRNDVINASCKTQHLVLTFFPLSFFVGDKCSCCSARSQASSCCCKWRTPYNYSFSHIWVPYIGPFIRTMCFLPVDKMHCHFLVPKLICSCQVNVVSAVVQSNGREIPHCNLE